MTVCEKLLARAPLIERHGIEKNIEELRAIRYEVGSERRNQMFMEHYHTYLNELEVRYATRNNEKSPLPFDWDEEGIRAMLALRLRLDQHSLRILDEKSIISDSMARLYLKELARISVTQRFPSSQHLSAFSRLTQVVPVIEHEVPKSPQYLEAALWTRIWKKALTEFVEICGRSLV
jgi:hypothetical protein